MSHKITLVEDDLNIARSIKILLQSEGLETSHFESAEEFLKRKSNDVDLYLIDVNLGGMSGLDLCREIRRKNHATPILFITANEQESVAVEALSIGSQDFIRKPFRSAEFLARINLHLKATTPPGTLSIAGLVMNIQARRCTHQGAEIRLTRNEYQLLKIFLENTDRVFSRLQLMEALQTDEDTNDRTIDTTLSRLKGKLKKEGVESVIFESVYGEGYRVKIKN